MFRPRANAKPVHNKSPWAFSPAGEKNQISIKTISVERFLNSIFQPGGLINTWGSRARTLTCLPVPPFLSGALPRLQKSLSAARTRLVGSPCPARTAQKITSASRYFSILPRDSAILSTGSSGLVAFRDPKRNQWLVWCGRHRGKYLGPNPVKKIKLLKEPKGRLRYLDEEEEANFLRHAKEPLRTIILVGIYAGLGIQTEALTLKWEDIDL